PCFDREIGMDTGFRNKCQRDFRFQGSMLMESGISERLLDTPSDAHIISLATGINIRQIP
ncbi:MAG: hypothetical protein IJG94_09170, partial [Clostridia bacterium]|nr:hypothetical protein [Clostridia bacterium]